MMFYEEKCNRYASLFFQSQGILKCSANFPVCEDVPQTEVCGTIHASRIRKWRE